jgi:hypothetical protein
MVRQINVRRHIAVLAIVTLVFIVGVFIGLRQGLDATSALASEYETIAIDSTMMDTLYLMEGSGMNESESCEAYSTLLKKFSQDISEFNYRMWVMENKLGKSDPSLLELKDKFNTLEVRNYLLLEKVDDVCGVNHTYILYFYSNKNYNPNRDQGKVIQEAITNNETIVYHFDTDIPNPVVSMLMKHYDVFMVPSIVVNKERYSGFKDKDDLKEILDGY